MKENKFLVQTAVCKVMASVFWDSEGILFSVILERVATISSGQTLKKLK